MADEPVNQTTPPLPPALPTVPEPVNPPEAANSAVSAEPVKAVPTMDMGEAVSTTPAVFPTPESSDNVTPENVEVPPVPTDTSLPPVGGKKFPTKAVASIAAALFVVTIMGSGLFFSLRQTSDIALTTETATKASGCEFVGDCFVGCELPVFLYTCPRQSSGQCNENQERTKCFKESFCGTQQLDVFPDPNSEACIDARDDYTACLASECGSPPDYTDECLAACSDKKAKMVQVCERYSDTRSRVDVSEATCNGAPPPGESPPPAGGGCGAPCTDVSQCSIPNAVNQACINDICWDAARCENNPPPGPCTESETCPGKDASGNTVVCGPTEDCIVRDRPSEDTNTWIWGCKTDKGCVEDTPNPSHEPPEGLVCKNLRANPESPQIGETARFICRSDGTKKVDHFEFRYRIGRGSDKGEWQDLPSGTAEAIEGEEKQFRGVSDLTIAQAGDYKVQCRVCKRADGNCTDWGKKN